jgi:hypothetical protein
MPTYTFHNKETGVVKDKMMSIADKERYLKDNPDVEQVHTGLNIVSGVGSIKTDSGWKENLSRIAEANPTSAFADRYGKKSIKDIKTRQVIEKHLRKQKK